MNNQSQTLTPEDLASIRPITDPQVSVDGTIQACVVHGPAPARGKAPSADIWAGRGGEPTAAVTSGPWIDLTPRLSPTGRMLAFASDRESAGLFRLYVLSLDGDEMPSEPQRITALPGVVEDIVWAADESAMIVRTADEGSDTGNIGGAKRFVPDGEEDEPFTVQRPASAWRRLHLVKLSGAVQQVSPVGLTIWDIGWAGHGPIAAVVSTDPSENGWYDAHLALIDTESREARTIYTPKWQLQSPAMSSDARTVAFLEAPQSDRALLAGSVIVMDLGTEAIARPAPGADVARVRWTDDGRLFWVGVGSVESACGFLVRGTTWRVEESWRGRAALGQAYLMSANCSRDGSTIVAGYQSHDQPPELREFKVSDGVGWRQRTSVNAELAGRVRSRESVHRWTAGDGLEIHGLLLLPPEPAPESGLPLIVVPHGGPTNTTSSTFAQGAHRGDAVLLTQAGCAVLLPNPRGSTGRGHEFMAAIIGDLGGGDLADIESGVESLVNEHIIDPARIGIVGISYGGFMSAWAAVRSKMFAASIPISGLMNWLSFHNTSNQGRMDELFLDSDPYDPTGRHLERSPVMYVNDCLTPTLLLHGDLDLACPLSQAQEFYQGLAAAGCETELVTYRGAGHGMSEREHVIDVSNRIVEWFTRHLKLGR